MNRYLITYMSHKGFNNLKNCVIFAKNEKSMKHQFQKEYKYDKIISYKVEGGQDNEQPIK